ncbi:MAG: ribosome biogenesis GTPase YlqF [Desulfobacterales bacterium RIFOXYA12_FULL_46_15]|nr:MAG: ribosome biogenesis GTPase YlqF [Desulfobacterales bacterium RIFOXYA12_FULL_46_15]
MTIQWFPGHMLETENLLIKEISSVDAVLEILDARLPFSSANPFVDKLCKNKFRLKVLNKTDLADPEETILWLEYFQKNRIPAVSICGIQPTHVFHALNDCVKKTSRNKARKLKIMVLGIPNTGKSTILNTLSGKKIAKTGNTPAITRHPQRTGLPNNIDIYDTPGILSPIIQPKEKAYLLAVSGAISDTAFDYREIALFAAAMLIRRYSHLLMDRYSFMNTVPDDPTLLIEKIGAARGCLKKGGVIDYQKASETLIRELRAGKIGKISFETPKDYENETP